MHTRKFFKNIPRVVYDIKNIFLYKICDIYTSSQYIKYFFHVKTFCALRRVCI